MNARDNYVNDDEQLEPEEDDENEPVEPDGRWGGYKTKINF